MSLNPTHIPQKKWRSYLYKVTNSVTLSSTPGHQIRLFRFSTQSIYAVTFCFWRVTLVECRMIQKSSVMMLTA